MSTLEAILRGAELGVQALKLAIPFFTPGGQVRVRKLIEEIGELIADEIEKEKFGRASTDLPPTTPDGG